MDSENPSDERLQKELATLRRQMAEVQASCKAVSGLAGSVYCCTLFEENPMMLFVVDEEGTVLSANHSGTELLGYSPEELIGQSILNIYHVEDRTAIKRHIEVSIREYNKVAFWELRKVRKDGTHIWVKAFARSLLSIDGSPRVYIACEDITERKRGEEAAEREKELSNALNRINDLIHSTLDFDEIMNRTVVEAVHSLRAESSSIGLFEGDAIIVKHVHHLPEELVGSKYSYLKHGIVEIVKRTKEAQVVNDAYADTRTNPEVAKTFHVRSFIAAPLISRGEAIGVLFFSHHSAYFPFTGTHVDFAKKFAASVSLALENSRLFSEAKQAGERAMFFARAIENSSQPFVALYPDGCLTHYNSAYVALTGYPPDELDAVTMTELTAPEYHDYEKTRLEELRHTGQPQLYQKEYVRKDGTRVPVEIKIHLVRDQKGEPDCYYAFVTDITERKRMEEEIRHMAHHDPLTGLSNRRLFMDIAHFEFAQAHRERRKLAVLFLDLDRFKEINDTLGHNTGDELLKAVAERLKTKVRKSDTIARIGGDEFNIILSHITHIEDIVFILQKMMESFREPFHISGHELHITASIGVSVYPDDSADIETLLRYADIAMYYAKEQGRNNYQFYNPAVHVRTLERIRLESNLRLTLDRGELMVYYQPQVDLRTGELVGVEALVRWRHPEFGLLDPGRFIPIAVETGFISSIGEWMVRTVCAQARNWFDSGLPRVCITVNFSAREFQDPGLVGRISRLLEETGLPSDSLDIEITESAAMSNIEHTIARLNELKAKGIHVAIDDFGTGCSSVNYLKRLPIRKLKIDKSFIRDIPFDPDVRTIIEAVIAMAHAMKVRVLAVGVETEEQLSFLRAAQCDEAQGYLFDGPLTAEQFNELVTSGM